MDDTSVQETLNVSKNNNLEEGIDPLDAYMLEIDQQVKKLDENDQLRQKASETLADEMKQKLLENNENNLNENKKISNSDSDHSEDENYEDEESIGKSGNFSTVEELIA